MVRQYKDSLFRFIFNNESAMRELYNGIKGTAYGEDTPVVINTLEESLLEGRHNDISFILAGSLVVAAEHQSTLNENMPLRFLDYITHIYMKSLESREALYHQRRIFIHRVEFWVFYNGEKPYPDRGEMRLSEAFKKVPGNDEVNLELVVKVFNVNEGRNQELMEKCERLRYYALFVGRVREYEAEEMGARPEGPKEENLRRAIERAIGYCKKRAILTECWERLTNEEVIMMTREWNWEEAVAVAKEEGIEEGLEKGREEERNQILGLMDQGYTASQIRQMLMEECARTAS